MFTKVTPLIAEKHGRLCLQTAKDYRFSANTHAVRLLASEIMPCACEYPVAFILSSQKDMYLPVALFSMLPRHNAFITADGLWRGQYIPAAIRHYPFTVVRNKHSAAGTQYIICIDEASPLLSATDGTPLFTSEGAESPLLQNIRAELLHVQEEEVLTHTFGKALAKHDLVAPLQVDVRSTQQTQRMEGLYAVSESRLNALTETAFLELRAALSPIYAHLTSLGQINHLLTRLRSEMAATTASGSGTGQNRFPLQ